MKGRLNSFLAKKAKNCLDKALKRLDEVESENLNEKEKKEIVGFVLKTFFFLSPIIVWRLLINSPWLIFRWLFSTNKNLYSPYGSFWLSLAKFLYSPQNYENVFKPIVADWREESLEALNKMEVRRIHVIRVRYTYAFLVAMWQKSPIGDLIEFVVKIAKK
jgi:hypothetical protein